MKKLWLSVLSGLIFLNFSYAQNTDPWPSTGPVGIGTTSPASGLMLDVIGNGSFSGALSLGLGGGGTNVFQQTLAHNYNGIPYVSYPGQFRWYASPNNSLYKDNALFQLRSWDAGTNTENTMATFTGGGNFGIGTTNPKDYLHVFSGTANSLTTAARLSGGDGGPDAGTSMLFTSAYSDGSWLTGRIGALSSGYGTDYGSSLVFHTNSGASTATLTEKMRIDKNGNVGIGTTSPSTMLHVTGPGTAYGNILTTVTPSLYSNGNASGLGYGLLSNSTFANQGAWSNIGLVQQTSNANDIAAGVHLAIYGWYQNSGTSLPISLGGGYAGMTPSVYIASGDAYGNGNVGIGTTTPGAILSLGGAVSNKKLFVYDGGNEASGFGQAGSELRIFDPVSGVNHISFGKYDLPSDAFSEQMRIEYNGSVGIGTTSPGAVLDVGKLLNPGDLGSVLARLPEGTGVGGGTYLGIKGYATQGSGDVKSFALEHSFYGITNSSINFFRGGGQTGGFISFNTNDNTEKMRISSNGNVAIGTTTPYPNAKFQTKLNTNINWGIDPGTGTGSVRLDAYNDAANANIPLELQGSTISLFGSGGALGLTVNSSGNVGVGTTDPKSYRFAVAGNAIAEQMTVKLQADWPDYIFKKDYTLMPLSELKTYIDKNHHLPEIPSAADVEKDGLNLGEMNKLLLKKMEELTLYLIEKDKEIAQQKQLNTSLEDRLNKIEKKLNGSN